ncbi:MAG TPA: Hsp70 family protein [Mycobacteriales bacterium]|nr:Hsp70 family protein [Mycobacteriales bacterium]
MRVLAVDFGTSNTVAGLGLDGGAPRLVTIDGSPLVPSSVFLTDEGTLAVGRDADRQARLDPSRYEPNPKRRIDDGTLLLGSTAVPVATVIAGVLGRVAGEVRRQLGSPPDQVRLTHPARWGWHRREILVVAARQAGLSDDPVLVPEPVAAATHFATLSGGGLSDGQALAVYDLGGGTLDIAVVARRGNGYQVLAEAGLADLGGLDFDHAVVEHIGRTHAERVDEPAWRRLLAPADAASRRMARALATDVRDGKEALSRYPHVDIALPQPFADVHLTRPEFEDLIRPNLARSIDLMRGTIADSGLEPAQLAGVYLVGGSSRVPLVARLIQQGLGVTPTTLEQPETSVVAGALYLGAADPAGYGPAARPTGILPVTTPGAPVLATTPPGGFPRSGPGPVPPGRQPPVPQPGGRPAQGFPGPRQASPARVRRRAVLLSGGGAVAVALAAVLVLVFTNGGGGGGGGLGGRGGPATGGNTGSRTNTSFDRFFSDARVRDYLRPVYGDIASCDTGALGVAVPGSATCTFHNGVQVTVGRADDTLLPLAQLRELIGTTEEAAEGFTREPGSWQGGSLDTFRSASQSGQSGSATAGAALYWDRRQGDIWGLATSDTLRPGQLRSWWQQHFGD